MNYIVSLLMIIIIIIILNIYNIYMCVLCMCAHIYIHTLVRTVYMQHAHAPCTKPTHTHALTHIRTEIRQTHVCIHKTSCTLRYNRRNFTFK